jgi:hypothetical protein
VHSDDHRKRRQCFKPPRKASRARRKRDQN